MVKSFVVLNIFVEIVCVCGCVCVCVVLVYPMLRGSNVLPTKIVIPVIFDFVGKLFEENFLYYTK